MSNRKVVFLIYDGVEVLDFTGPFDVFSMANISGAKEPFELITVSPDGNAIQTMHGLTITPNYSIDNYPKEHTSVLIIPGGLPSIMKEFDKRYPAVMDWITDMRHHSKVVASVCIGALIAAKAGVFDGLKATTHHGFLRDLRTYTDGKAIIEAGNRYVNNSGSPQTISSAGVSSGMDMAFFLLGQLEGPEVQRATANVMEYNGTVNWLYS